MAPGENLLSHVQTCCFNIIISTIFIVEESLLFHDSVVSRVFILSSWVAYNWRISWCIVGTGIRLSMLGYTQWSVPWDSLTPHWVVVRHWTWFWVIYIPLVRVWERIRSLIGMLIIEIVHGLHTPRTGIWHVVMVMWLLEPIKTVAWTSTWSQIVSIRWWSSYLRTGGCQSGAHMGSIIEIVILPFMRTLFPLLHLKMMMVLFLGILNPFNLQIFPLSIVVFHYSG